ncbi:hypothetical protein NX02_02670 [Sphingomonas sanxanigenens DSM 19645 = NX02]|uniref:Uncharacterized protein n=1 Tax=Sphingomonas sanxanigenens DSM 19645 = NX02 TaxID=1123269 RepID=W0A742_9SPHN|nr:hypothetical protein NX02_02670 [Sphingomonas sanxanigenens DSM 19645 = NX02]
MYKYLIVSFGYNDFLSGSMVIFQRCVQYFSELVESGVG